MQGGSMMLNLKQETNNISSLTLQYNNKKIKND